MLLGQTSGNHAGTLCTGAAPSGISGYDWQFHGRAGAPASSRPSIATWGTYQWRNCHQTQPNTFVEVRNLRVYARVGSGWQHYAGQNDPFNWCGNMEVDTFAHRGDCQRFGNTYQMPTGLNGQWVVHWGESDETKKAGLVCQVAMYEARVIGNGQVMANSGLDWRQNNGSFGDSWFGSYVLLTAEWQTIGGTSCSASQLNPPPPGVSA